MFVRAWKDMGGHEDIAAAATAEVHFPDGRIVQISCAGPGDPRGEGTVLLSAFPPNGTAEAGGANLTDLTMLFTLGVEGSEVRSVELASPDAQARIRALNPPQAV